MDVLKDLFDNLNDSLIIINAQGQVVLFNVEAQRIQQSISGRPIRIGDNFSELVSAERRPAVSEILKTLKRQKKPVKNFAEYNTPFGTSVFLEVNFVPVFGARKELRYVNIITMDITSRKLFEKKVKATTADVSNLLENAHAVIFSVDSRGYIVDWNNHSATLTEYPKSEILSRKFSDVLVNPSAQPAFKNLMECMQRNQPVGNCELTLKKKNGGEVIVMLSATPRTNAHGKVIGSTMVGQDVTELTMYRRSLEKQVENNSAVLEQVLRKEKEAVEMKSRFVSIASHEFRSPLSSIDFAASFIKKNAATIGKKKLNEKVEVIERHVNYMSHLLEDVLNFSKSDSGTIKPVPSKICLDEFIRNAVDEVVCQFKHSHHICVSTNELEPLVTDEKLLRNIVVNLLTNAVKFSPDREEVSLYVHDEGAFVSLEVSDEGIGIPEEEMAMIFEPFVRGRGAEEIQGTGLGLSIVKKAVEILHGSIQVKSKPGKGSVFRVVIPRQNTVK